jgi:citrate synthase
MRIGKQDAPYQSICASDATSVTVRGHDLCTNIIGTLDFTSYFWLLVTGTPPTPPQRAMADAVLTAIAEHGLVPSVVAARMTLAAAPEALQGAVAAGLLGCGSVVLGSAEVAADFYTACLDTEVDPDELPAVVHRAITDLRIAQTTAEKIGEGRLPVLRDTRAKHLRHGHRRERHIPVAGMNIGFAPDFRRIFH